MRPKQKLSIVIYLQLKTSFILLDDEVIFSQKHSETAPNSISSVLVKCTKIEYFSHGGSNFASNFPSRQAYQNAVNHVFEKQMYILLRITQVLRFFTKNNDIITNDIEGNVLFYRVVRVIPH